ncbi:uncharacterized protein TrAtP1_002015 [Trichoderma atroviride]|uniref:uncharacterized protein n=1 Tax=Hypocrea atroviridis TaxID=63577 RepID=UPI00332AFA6C|nr:hypothetical protein TrAtP1_002015 [Trichoderma atroviride]
MASFSFSFSSFFVIFFLLAIFHVYTSFPLRGLWDKLHTVPQLRPPFFCTRSSQEFSAPTQHLSWRDNGSSSNLGLRPCVQPSANATLAQSEKDSLQLYCVQHTKYTVPNSRMKGH